MFVLTQLPTFPPITKCFRPERRSEAVHRRCWPSLDLSWSGSGLDRVWSWWLLGCLEDWSAKHSITQSLLGGTSGPTGSGTGSLFFSYIMRKYAYRRRGYRGHKPSYTVNRKFCRNLTWNKLANDADIYTAAVQLVYNPSVESSNQLGTILTIKHLEVQLQDLPTYYGLNQDTNVVGHGSLAGGWICVYVPEGTSLNKPFPDYATGKDNYTFYEPNQFVLGHGTWLEGWQIYQSNDILKIRDAGTVGISQVPDTSAGNNMRIRVPLSKKLNPGDAIYMIYYVVHTPNLANASVTGCSSVVKYASKAN